MLRLSILQSVNGAVLKLNINENRFLTKCMSNLKRSNRKVKEKRTSELQGTTDSDIDGNVCKQIKYMEVMTNIKSVSIFGSETIESCGIQCSKDNKDLRIPTVTQVLSETMSPKVKIALESWKKNMINMYGEEYFKAHCKGTLRNSKLFHSCAQMMFSKNETEIPFPIRQIYFNMKPILDNMQILHGTQTTIIHPTLRYKGIIDCIASFRGHTYLIECKILRMRKAPLAVTYNASIEVAAYIGAINAFNNYSLKIDKGLVIVTYVSDEPASIHILKGDALQAAWREWLIRLEQFHANYEER